MSIQRAWIRAGIVLSTSAATAMLTIAALAAIAPPAASAVGHAPGDTVTSAAGTATPAGSPASIKTTSTLTLSPTTSATAATRPGSPAAPAPSAPAPSAPAPATPEAAKKTTNTTPAASTGTATTTRPATSTPSAKKGVVYLTFDDGPGPATPEVLALLAQHHVTATFFVTGSNAAANPRLLSAIRAGGHAVGDHTWDHPQLTKLSAAGVTDQLNRTEAVIGKTRCVRPPYGDTSPTIAGIIAARGERQILWDVDPKDWSRPGADVIVDRVMSQVRPGSIVLMHDAGGDRSQSVAALRIILDRLDTQGLRSVALPQC